MAEEYDYETHTMSQQVTCQECNTKLGGPGQPDIYKHMLHCLNVEQGKVQRINDQALANGDENGRRVASLCDVLLGRR